MNDKALEPMLLLLKLALRACERGDADGAAQALRGVLAMDLVPTSAAPSSSCAVSVSELAKMLGYSTRHLRTLIAHGTIPPDAVLAQGRARRILVERAIEALRLSATAKRPPVGDIEREGAEYVRRRSRFRVVGKGRPGGTPEER